MTFLFSSGSNISIKNDSARIKFHPAKVLIRTFLNIWTLLFHLKNLLPKQWECHNKFATTSTSTTTTTTLIISWCLIVATVVKTVPVYYARTTERQDESASGFPLTHAHLLVSTTRGNQLITQSKQVVIAMENGSRYTTSASYIRLHQVAIRNLTGWLEAKGNIPR